jgi:hypothetical protein
MHYGVRDLDRKNESAAIDEALPKFNALTDHGIVLS